MSGGFCPNAVKGFTKEMLIEIQKRCNNKHLIDIRDLCAFAVCFEGALRSSELLSIKMNDLSMNEEYIEITIRRSKTDQFGVGRNIYLYKLESQVSAYKLLDEYLHFLSAQNLKSEYLFISSNGKKFTDRNFRDRIKHWIQVIGMDPAEFSTHSLCVGAVETATLHHIPPPAIKQQSGWKSNCFMRYARISEQEASELMKEAFK